MSNSILKSILFLCLGATPGIALFVFLGFGAYLVVAILGGLIGLALSWPSTSIRNIGRLTTDVFVSHNLNNASGSQVAESLFGKEEEPKCNWIDLKQSDSISLTDAGAKRLSEYRPSPGMPVRLSAEINKDIPNYLIYNMTFEESFWPNRDERCSLKGIDFVLDRLTAQRMRKTTLDWNDTEQGFKFDSPEWPRTELDREPWQDD